MSISALVVKRSSATAKYPLKKTVLAIGEKEYLAKYLYKLGRVVILLDKSGSMDGDKLRQAKNGIIDLVADICNKFTVDVAVFSDVASLICSEAKIEAVKSSFSEIEADSSTNLTDALCLAERQLAETKGQKIIVVATDGQPNSVKGSLEIADKLKASGIEIIAIGTDRADEDFLKKIASRKDMGYLVEKESFRQAIVSINKKIKMLSAPA